ncbi:hypothetical protein ACQ4PT_002125 [Festuca glaucescens]
MSASSSLPSDFVGWNLMVDSLKYCTHTVVTLLQTSRARHYCSTNLLGSFLLRAANSPVPFIHTTTPVTCSQHRRVLPHNTTTPPTVKQDAACPHRPPGLTAGGGYGVGDSQRRRPPGARQLFRGPRGRSCRHRGAPALSEVFEAPQGTPGASYDAHEHAEGCHLRVALRVRAHHPATAPCRAEPGAFVRLVFRTLALDLPHTFELFPTDGDGDVALRFRTPAEREAAMRRQPFELDGATVRLSRDEDEIEVPDVPDDRHRYMVHAALHIEQHCRRFGFLREIDPACFAKPDLATVRVILQLEHPRETPHEIVIEYFDGTTSRIPVTICMVWDCSESYDARLDGTCVSSRTLLRQPDASVCLWAAMMPRISLMSGIRMK